MTTALDALRSPTTGEPLRADTAASLADGERRWPVVAGVPWLRAGRDEVRERALHALDRGDGDGAAVVLLADADDWWDEPAPPPERLRAALRAPTLRSAADGLGLGRVGTYFAHRWSDPSWLAVLALTAAHPPAGRPVTDLACGAGHLLRHLALHGERRLTGVDVVFAKLWLARRFVVPDTVDLVCADLTAPWPLAAPAGPAGPSEPGWVACHDALYFLADKRAVVDRARAHAGGGAVLLGHLHNAAHPAGGGGLPLDVDGWRALLPGATAYADEELTAAALAGRAPRPAGPDLAGTEAVALALDPDGPGPRPELADPVGPLRPNPLYVDGERRWPGERWAQEYGPRAAGYLPPRWPQTPPPDAARRRLLLDLPEAW